MSGNGKCIHVLSFALALGIVSALFTFVIGLLSMTGYAGAYVHLLESVYIGYDGSFWGSGLGAIWAFGYGFVLGYVFAWLYNYVCCMYCKVCGTDKK